MQGFCSRCFARSLDSDSIEGMLAQVLGEAGQPAGAPAGPRCAGGAAIFASCRSLWLGSSLHESARAGHAVAVQVLLFAKADVQYLDWDGAQQRLVAPLDVAKGDAVEALRLEQSDVLSEAVETTGAASDDPVRA